MIAILKYTAKVWITTALLAPLVFISVSLLIHAHGFMSGLGEVASTYFLFVCVELAFSFVTAMLFCLAVTIIVQQNLNPVKQQKALFISALIFGVITFMIFLVLLGSPLSILADTVVCAVVISNLACLAFSAIIYKIPQTEY